MEPRERPDPQQAPKDDPDERPVDPGRDERPDEERIHEKTEQEAREKAGVPGSVRPDDPAQGAPLGRNEEALHGIHDL